MSILFEVRIHEIFLSKQTTQNSQAILKLLMTFDHRSNIDKVWQQFIV